MDADISPLYVTVVGKGDELDHDLKVEWGESGGLTVTDLVSSESATFDDEWNMPNSNILETDPQSDNHNSIQYLGQQGNEDLKFDFFYQGGRVQTIVYDSIQYKYKGFMAPPVKIDSTKSILSPMPGAVVSVNVTPGQQVVDGQELCIIEAMKMQNILKAERDGSIKSVNVQAGDSVTVD